MATLQVLIGLIINRIEEMHDYVQIVFSDGTTLSIFNNYAYDGGSLLSIEGKKLTSIEESSHLVRIILEDNDVLSVSLDDNDYNGPEAMLLKQRGKPPIIWN